MASASKAQIKANRQNAKRSTGPTSIQGKLKVSQNAITHGIFATAPLLETENLEEYQLLYDSLFKELMPASQLEAAIVERIIHSIWRQKRLEKAEAAKIAIEQLPQQLIFEVNATMMREPKEWVQIEDLIGEKDHKKFQVNKVIQEELEALDIQSINSASAASMTQQAPYVFHHLKLEAKNQNMSLESFLDDAPKVTEYLSALKRGAEKFVSKSITRQFAKIVSDLVSQTKLIPKPMMIEQLMKYQVQLDNDLYKAINELRKLQEWRLKTIEAERVE